MQGGNAVGGGWGISRLRLEFAIAEWGVNRLGWGINRLRLEFAIAEWGVNR